METNSCVQVFHLINLKLFYICMHYIFFYIKYIRTSIWIFTVPSPHTLSEFKILLFFIFILSLKQVRYANSNVMYLRKISFIYKNVTMFIKKEETNECHYNHLYIHYFFSSYRSENKKKCKNCIIYLWNLDILRGP